MKLRIPSEDEIKIVLKWGAIRIVLAGGQLSIYGIKQLFKLGYHSFDAIEKLYTTSLVKPFDALIWNETPTLPETNEPRLIQESIELFDWNRFRNETNSFPHIRIIAKSGMGKTTLARYLLHQLNGKQCVVTPKAKPNDWKGVQVIGKGFRYDSIECALIQIKDLMYANYILIEQSLTPEMNNIVLDEWRLIKENVECASDICKELITVARDAKIRLLCLAQGEQVSTWGLEGESDLAECFTDIRLGEFAIDYARKIKLPSNVLDFLNKQSRPCMVGRYPALIPDLSSFQFVDADKCLELPEHSETLRNEERNEKNEVSENQDLLEKSYRFAKTNGVSDSDFIKHFFGTSRYSEGKQFISSLK